MDAKNVRGMERMKMVLNKNKNLFRRPITGWSAGARRVYLGEGP